MKTVFVVHRYCLVYRQLTVMGLAECRSGAVNIMAAAKRDDEKMFHEWARRDPVGSCGKGPERYEWTIEEQEVKPCECP